MNWTDFVSGFCLGMSLMAGAVFAVAEWRKARDSRGRYTRNRSPKPRG